MRVAFVVWPAPAHLYPVVPLAWALRSAGHEVYVASHPSIGDAVTGQGLPFAPLCAPDAMPHPLGPGGVWGRERADVGQITAVLDLPVQDIGTWMTFSQFLLPTMWDFMPYKASPETPMPAMDGLVEFFRGWRPDLVIWDPCMPGAAVAARAVGARQARYTGPDHVGWSMDTFIRLAGDLGASRVDNPLVETVRPMAERYGVDVDRELLLGEWTINPMPSSINLPVDTRVLPVQWIPHVTQEAVPPWLYPVPERPRIAVSLGVSTRAYMAADWSHVGLLLDALGELDVEVVATLNDVQLAQVTRVPENVRLIDYFPLDQLMPTCSLLIHHGGLASMVTAAYSRVPQLVVDFLDLQIGVTTSEDGVVTGSRYPLAPVTGGFVTGHGAGEVLDLSKPGVDVIRDQVARVATEPAFREGAARLHEELMLSPTPGGIVPMLEQFAARRR